MKAFENIVGTGKNAGNQHFILFPQCILPYQSEKSSFQQHNIFYPSINKFQCFTLCDTILTFNNPEKEGF